VAVSSVMIVYLEGLRGTGAGVSLCQSG